MPQTRDIDAFLTEVDRQGALPSPPAVALEVLRVCQNPSASVRDVAQVISKDPALSGKLLKTVNSALFGLATRVGSIEQASVILGLRSIQILALGFSLISRVARKGPKNFDYQYYWRNAVTAAVAARLLARTTSPRLRDEAYLCGLLQDIGVLVLQQCAPKQYDAVLRARSTSCEELCELERQVFGFSHADLSGKLLARWGLPAMLTEAVAHHHQPRQLQTDQPAGQLALLLSVAGIVARLFCDPLKSPTLAAVYRSAADCLAMQPAQLDETLRSVQGHVRENARLFDLEIGQTEPFYKIQQQARLELARLGLEAQRELQRSASRQIALVGERYRLLEKSMTDHLTGLANRAALDRRLAQHLQQRDSQPPFSILMVDVDHFKQVNDRFGHPVGDGVLTHVARLVKSHTRSHDLAARYGGDEFVVVLTGANLDQARSVAERMRLAILRANAQADLPTRVTVSIGAACSSELPRDAAGQDLIDQADHRLYAAKQAGRNCVAPAADG